MSYVSKQVQRYVKGQILIALLSVGICSAAITSNSYGQEVDSNSPVLKYWVQSGPSVNTLGTGLYGSIGIDYNNHVFSLRATSTNTTINAETWDIGLLYGRSMNFKNFYFSGGTGISVIGGKGYSDLFGNHEQVDIETSIGFPIEGQIYWEPIWFISLGIYSFANINTGQPFGGMGLSFRLGRF